MARIVGAMLVLWAWNAGQVETAGFDVQQQTPTRQQIVSIVSTSGCSMLGDNAIQ
jgi:hypothetical protein